MQQAQIPYDEFAQAETLQAVGFKPDQAREIVRVAASIKTEHLATKEQLTKVEAGLNSRIDAVRTELKEDIAENKASIERVRHELKENISKVKISCFKMILGALSIQTGLLTAIMGILKFWY